MRPCGLQPTMSLKLRIVDHMRVRFGGRASAIVICNLGAVLALQGADLGAVSAMVDRLETALQISKTQVGLLLTLTLFASAIATVPFGWLVDRFNRTRLLTYTIMLWSVTMVVSATANTYLYLLLTRLALGIVTSVAVPAVASLVGDFYPPRFRGRIFGYILSGEIIGTGLGFIGAGELAEISWRAGFIGLAVPAIIISWYMRRLPEPAHDGTSRLKPGQVNFTKCENPVSDFENNRELSDSRGPSTSLIQDRLREAHVKPRSNLIYDKDPVDRSIWWAIWYVLRIPTNLVLILASALGYFFFAGAITFALDFLENQFSLSHSASIWFLALMGTGTLLGVVGSGRLGDKLLASGHLNGRVIVVTVSYMVVVVLFISGIIAGSLSISVPLFFLAAVALGSVNPSLDAARLDIMHPHLWGRAESIRMTFRTVTQAIAPLLFGYFSDQFFGDKISGLRETFMIMLIPLFISGLIAFVSFRTYPRDVATADAFMRKTMGKLET